METLLLVFSFALGAVIGSFTNVLIYRVPRQESVAFPPSHCPNCDHRLGVLDLVPIFSWLALRGRCRYCSNPISGRYPVVELISGLGYLVIAWKFPLADYGIITPALWLLFTMLLAGSAIDLETKILPDQFTLPLLVLGLVLALLAKSNGVFPGFQASLEGACIGAGILALIAGVGAWLVRKFSETKYPTSPIDYQTVHFAGLLGAWAGALQGPVWAMLAGLMVLIVHGAINQVSKRYWRIPDWLSFGGLILSLMMPLGINVTLLGLAQGAALGAGAAAIVAGVLWVFLPDPWAHIPEEDLDPVAMGFGDVKLLAAIGAFLGWQGVVFGLATAVLLGALLGLAGRAFGGVREIPFGPYIAVGALVALLTGSAPLLSYLKQFGL